MKGLKPAFDKRSGQGTLTAGNSTPLTDGASVALLASEDWAAAHGIEPLAYFVDSETAAVDFVSGADGLLMAPTYAVPRLLAHNGLTLADFDAIHASPPCQRYSKARGLAKPDYPKLIEPVREPLLAHADALRAAADG